MYAYFFSNCEEINLSKATVTPPLNFGVSGIIVRNRTTLHDVSAMGGEELVRRLGGFGHVQNLAVIPGIVWYREIKYDVMAINMTFRHTCSYHLKILFKNSNGIPIQIMCDGRTTSYDVVRWSRVQLETS